MELFKKILVVVLAIVVIYFILIFVVEIINMTMRPKPSNSNGSGLIKIIAAPIVQTIPSQGTNIHQGVCTADAFVCPSGISVGRTGSNCQFVCPNINR